MDPIIAVGKILYADIHHLKDILLIVLALITNAQAFADATADAIGADYPARPRDLLRAVGQTQGDFDTVRTLVERHQLNAPLRTEVIGRFEMLAKNPLCLVLIVDEDEWITAGQSREVERRPLRRVLEIKREAVALDAIFEIAVRDPDMLHHLERARMQGEGL